MEEFLRIAEDTCHGSTQNRKLADVGLTLSSAPELTPHQQSRRLRQPPQSGRSHQYCRPVLSDQATSGSPFSAASVPAATSDMQSGRRHCEIRSMRQLACTSKLGLDEERLLTDDVRSAPLFMTALENFRLRSWA